MGAPAATNKQAYYCLQAAPFPPMSTIGVPLCGSLRAIFALTITLPLDPIKIIDIRGLN